MAGVINGIIVGVVAGVVASRADDFVDAVVVAVHIVVVDAVRVGGDGESPVLPGRDGDDKVVGGAAGGGVGRRHRKQSGQKHQDGGRDARQTTGAANDVPICHVFSPWFAI